MIVLDFGSGETCHNNKKIVKRMIEGLAAVDTRKKNVVIKWQLWSGAMPYAGGILKRLDPKIYQYAVDCGKEYGYETFSSVFDKESLDFLLSTDPLFVKIACRPELYSLATRIEGTRFLVSVPPGNPHRLSLDIIKLCCISNYPAEEGAYYKGFDRSALYCGISDHTTNFNLYNRYHPAVYECHFKLPDSIGADSGDYARTPEQLKEIL